MTKRLNPRRRRAAYERRVGQAAPTVHELMDPAFRWRRQSAIRARQLLERSR